MRVGQRLFVAVLPGVLGLAVVAGLAYWGEYGRQAPELLVAVAAVAMVVSLAAAWVNTRYVARRIEALAPLRRAAANPRAYVDALRGSASLEPDELDAIEAAVAGLVGRLETMEQALASARADHDAMGQRWGVLLQAAAEAAHRDTASARTPLHILLEHGFGELNENQEELADAASADLLRAERTLATVARLGALLAAPEAARGARLTLGPLLEETARRVGDHIEVDPAWRTLPAVRGDATLVRALLQRLLPDEASAVRVEVQTEGPHVLVGLSGIPAASPETRALAQAVQASFGGQLQEHAHGVRLAFVRW